MPRLDRTGPKGKGSRSGRGLGKCNSQGEKHDAQNDSEEKVTGRGLGRGFGAKRGKGRGQGLGRDQ